MPYLAQFFGPTAATHVGVSGHIVEDILRFLELNPMSLEAFSRTYPQYNSQIIEAVTLALTAAKTLNDRETKAT